MTSTIRRILVASVVSLAFLLGLTGTSQAVNTVTISGNAYAFIFAGNEARLEGATIGIEEIPGLTTTAGPNGAYALAVPDDTTVTPYAQIDGYYPTHVQTFHTSGQDLRQVNFQMPALNIYNLLAGAVNAETEPDGSLSKCGVVSTFFQKEGRSFGNFDDFHAFRPHGVEGSTAALAPASGEQFYFNDDVLPDPAQTSSSRDGGVLWVNVETGVYEVRAQSDTTRHSSFVATCAPGRLVNANPPWGLYELAGNENLNPAILRDATVHARLSGSGIARRGNPPRPTLRLWLNGTEPVTAVFRLSQRRGIRSSQPSVSMRRTASVPAGAQYLQFPLPRRFRTGRAWLQTTLIDPAGNLRNTSANLFVPRR
jgi:hypothetical protein